ncbi:MAG: Sapep family Mn(2+)-dependent dipeptidase [Oscillospiraceae bacterium]|nr:Sapep family Mn(2+)-dependent dipeptidase [Oscillospiraceae bacterium]
MFEPFMSGVDAFIRENEEAIVRDIARLVSINSVGGPAEDDAPYGFGPKAALDLGLQIAEELGLKAVNCGNRIGYAALGEGDRYLATITHLDVVPAGEGWPADPFTLREQEGYLLGRGVMDDKGPSVLCLYALKYLKEQNVPLRYPIRALLGTDEERGMSDLEYYLAHYEAPLFCFSPDADFPLCNGEKGIYHGHMTSNHPFGNVLSIQGGVAPNAVPAKAEATVRAILLPNTGSVTAEEIEPGIWHLTAVGISGHASVPEGTVNAIRVLTDYMMENRIPDENELPFFRVLQRFHSETDGSPLGLASSDGHFKPLTIVGGKITTEDGKITQTIDSRYGTTMSAEIIRSTLQKLAGNCCEVVTDSDAVPFYMDLSNPAVIACIDSYNEVTGENAAPYTIGGGTYARHFPNAVSFGPEHPERPCPVFCGPMHGVNEAACKADFLEALKIYILALLRLEALDY